MIDSVFKSLFEGLRGYEILMVVLGTLFFIVLLVRLLRTRDNYGGLIAFFLLAIVMIGYPSIQKIKYDNGVVEIDKIGSGEVPPPSDPKARASVAETLAFVEQRAPTPITQARVAAAYQKIGDAGKALDIAQKVAPGASPQVATTLAPIFAAKLKALPTEQPTPAEQQEIAMLTKHLETATLTPEQQIALAGGQAALGKKEDAVRTIEAAKRVDPHVAISPKLERALHGTQ
jgi:hypothetical protein